MDQTTAARHPRQGARVAGRLLTAVSIVGALLVGFSTPSSPAPAAAFTTTNVNADGTPNHCLNGGDPNSDPVNCNHYDAKDFVWLNGGPAGAALDDGYYFFTVLVPGGAHDPNDGGAKVLSDQTAAPWLGGETNSDGSTVPSGDAASNRLFQVTAGVVSYGGTHTFDSGKIRVFPFDDTTNAGGVYILAICALPGNQIATVVPSDCKYDAFKALEGEGGEVTPASDLSITKGADGAYDTSYTWDIDKSVDRTYVQQASGNVTFNYTVSVSHDAGTVGNVIVSGAIQVFNPNVDGDLQTVAVSGVEVTDVLSDLTECAVTGGTNVTLTQFRTDFPYTCALTGVPQGQLDNTATVTWPAQLLDDGTELAAGNASFTFFTVNFAEDDKIDECVDVGDVFNGGSSDNVGQACVGDANPTSFTYSRQVGVAASTCINRNNTATFVTNDNEASENDSASVTVCGAVAGGRTIGFWQNSNGQYIIKHGAATSGVCNSGTYLRTYKPFQDLSAYANCTTVASYAYNLVKKANAKGASMNAMLKAQMMATALDVYFSTPGLGGNQIGAPVPLGGVNVDLAVLNTLGGFGPGGSCRTVNDLLSYASTQSNVGGTVWYAQNKVTQEKAKTTFDKINNGVALTCI